LLSFSAAVVSVVGTISTAIVVVLIGAVPAVSLMLFVSSEVSCSFSLVLAFSSINSEVIVVVVRIFAVLLLLICSVDSLLAALLLGFSVLLVVVVINKFLLTICQALRIQVSQEFILFLSYS